MTPQREIASESDVISWSLLLFHLLFHSQRLSLAEILYPQATVDLDPGDVVTDEMPHHLFEFSRLL